MAVPERVAALREIHEMGQHGLSAVRRARETASVSEMARAAGEMGRDARQLVQVAYLRLFASTMVASFAVLYLAVFVYDVVLPAVFERLGLSALATQLEGATIAGTDLVLFALVAAVPMINCGRLLFVSRISGQRVVERFTLRSLFRREGVELVILVAIVPFLSREIFTATGVPNMINTLSPVADTVLGPGSVVEVRTWATTVSILYLYPSIVLLYLSHSKLSRLYPFTQFLSIAKSWSYVLLVLSILPVAAAYLVVMDEVSWSASSDVQLMLAFVVLTTVTLQFVFVRLGSIVVGDEKMRATFADEVGRETQRTLSEFCTHSDFDSSQ